MAKKIITKLASRKPWTLTRALPWILVVCGTIGVVCSLVLAYDQVQIWQNPRYQPACSLNPIISCGNVMDSGKGKIFDMPATFFGLLAFPALITVGVAILAGAQFKRWFWRLVVLGAAGGVTFALWLFWLSLYSIKALCPFCLTVDIVTYVAAWYITLYAIDNTYVTLPTQLTRAYTFVRRHHLDILFAWFLVCIAEILHQFWYYFGQYV